MTFVRAIKIILFSKDDDDVEHSLQTFFCKMLFIGRALCYVLAVVFTVIAVITNRFDVYRWILVLLESLYHLISIFFSCSQNSNRRVPPVKPFFTRETYVEDFYEGELYYASLKGSKHDIIFMMLYAPWDADSQSARIEFETACRYYHKKVNNLNFIRS